MQDTPIVVRRIPCGTPWKPHNMVAATTRIVLALNRVTRWMVEKEPICVSTSDHIPLITGYVTVDTKKTIWVD